MIKKLFLLLTNTAGYHPVLVTPSTTDGASKLNRLINLPLHLFKKPGFVWAKKVANYCQAKLKLRLANLLTWLMMILGPGSRISWRDHPGHYRVKGEIKEPAERAATFRLFLIGQSGMPSIISFLVDSTKLSTLLKRSDHVRLVQGLQISFRTRLARLG